VNGTHTLHPEAEVGHDEGTLQSDENGGECERMMTDQDPKQLVGTQ